MADAGTRARKCGDARRFFEAEKAKIWGCLERGEVLRRLARERPARMIPAPPGIPNGTGERP
jgi:hypothetical protein